MDADTPPLKDRIAELGALQEQLRISNQRVANLSALVEISKIINSTLDLDTLLTMIMEIIKQVLNAESGSLMLLDERGDELLYRVALGEKGSRLKERFRLKIGQGIAGWGAAHGEPLLVPDAARDARFYGAPDKTLNHRTRSILCVPLRGQGKLLGVLEAINSKSPGGFTPDDLSLFLAFASQAAVAIESARMHERLLEKQRVEQELKIANQIQRNFLPSSFPKPAGARVYARTVPAWETGGDFYDVVELGPRRLGVVVGDVSGKGVPAALYMVQVLSEFRFRASAADGTDAVLGRLNDGLLVHGTSGMFVTLVYAIVDAAARLLSFSSAGHLPMLWRRSGGGTELLEGPSGMPLGISAGVRYPMHTVALGRGDLLFLYTDGIIEARDRKGREFGIARLKNILGGPAAGPEAAVRRVMRRVETFSRGVPQYDDLTALALRMG